MFTCFTCLGFYPNPASSNTFTELAQANSTVPTKQAVLRPASQGPDVQRLQTNLKELGYYNGLANGQYSRSTQIAVAKFQKAKGLKRVDGVADVATQSHLQTALALKTQFSLSPVVASLTSTAEPTAKPKENQRGLIWWSLFGLGVLGSIGAILFLIRWFRQSKQTQPANNSGLKALSSPQKAVSTPSLPESDNTLNQQENPVFETVPQTAKASIPTAVLPPDKTSRLPKVNVIDELIKDLRGNDPTKRRKAIWDLGQQGDSRAIQPLVDLMMDADSQERSLILAALAEISTRTLKPMNRALAISMQDESPQVRQNAIRDLTRVYDMMNQMSQMLSHALEDSDAQVQSTARYALTQMNKMRALPPQQRLPEDSHKDSQD